MSLLNIFDKNQNAKNRSHIKNLIEVSISDGKLDNRELDYIIMIAGNYGITKEEVISMGANHKEIEFTPPSSYNAKVRLMEDSVKVLLADKMIEEDEVKFCKGLARKLKLNEFVVDDLINSILNKT